MTEAAAQMYQQAGLITCFGWFLVIVIVAVIITA